MPTIKDFRLVVEEDKIILQWLNAEEDLWMTECTYHLAHAKFSNSKDAKKVRAVWAGIFERMAYINQVWRPRWQFVCNYKEDTWV